MTPERKVTIKGRKVEEYYWGGKLVVYLDNRAVVGTFDEVCDAIRKGQPVVEVT